MRHHVPITTGDVSPDFLSHAKCLQFLQLALEIIGVYLLELSCLRQKTFCCEELLSAN